MVLKFLLKINRIFSQIPKNYSSNLKSAKIQSNWLLKNVFKHIFRWGWNRDYKKDKVMSRQEHNMNKESIWKELIGRETKLTIKVQDSSYRWTHVLTSYFKIKTNDKFNVKWLHLVGLIVAMKKTDTVDMIYVSGLMAHIQGVKPASLGWVIGLRRRTSNSRYR